MRKRDLGTLLGALAANETEDKKKQQKQQNSAADSHPNNKPKRIREVR